jgi:hypothetical protein
MSPYIIVQRFRLSLCQRAAREKNLPRC